MSKTELACLAKEYVGKQLAVMFKGKKAAITPQKKEQLVQAAIRVVKP